MTQLILIRHGQSVWNAENKFTGWVDSPLSNQGISEAKKAGRLIKKNKLIIHKCYTSFLSRAIKTLEILLKESDSFNLSVNKFWQLNERHYGALTGLNKKQTEVQVGSELFLKYRRSWDMAPPEIEIENKSIKLFSELNKTIPRSQIPKTESLKDTYERVNQFYKDNISEKLRNRCYVIVAHGNSLRALCKNLFSISDNNISKLEIPTGNPMVIKFNDNNLIKSAEYLDNARALPLTNFLDKL